MKLDDVVKRISRFRISAVSKASGLSRPAIIAIQTGRTPNPGILTLEKLESGLQKLEQDAIKTKSRKSAKPASAEAVVK